MKRLTRKQLAKLNDNELLDYFINRARYTPTSAAMPCVSWTYTIRLDSRYLHSHDTHDLRKKFFKAVRGE